MARQSSWTVCGLALAVVALASCQDAGFLGLSEKPRPETEERVSPNEADRSGVRAADRGGQPMAPTSRNPGLPGGENAPSGEAPIPGSEAFPPYGNNPAGVQPPGGVPPGGLPPGGVPPTLYPPGGLPPGGLPPGSSGVTTGGGGSSGGTTTVLGKPPTSGGSGGGQGGSGINPGMPGYGGGSGSVGGGTDASGPIDPNEGFPGGGSGGNSRGGSGGGSSADNGGPGGSSGGGSDGSLGGGSDGAGSSSGDGSGSTGSQNPGSGSSSPDGSLGGGSDGGNIPGPVPSEDFPNGTPIDDPIIVTTPGGGGSLGGVATTPLPPWLIRPPTPGRPPVVGWPPPVPHMDKPPYPAPPTKVWLELEVIQAVHESWWKNCLWVAVEGSQDWVQIGCNKDPEATGKRVFLLANEYPACNSVLVFVETYHNLGNVCAMRQQQGLSCEGPYAPHGSFDYSRNPAYSHEAPFYRVYDHQGIQNPDPLIKPNGNWVLGDVKALSSEMQAYGAGGRNKWLRVFFEDQPRENLDRTAAQPDQWKRYGIDFNDYVFDVKGKNVKFTVKGSGLSCEAK